MPLYEHLYTLTMSSAECRICVTTEILTKTFMWSIFSKKNVPSLTTFNRSWGRQSAAPTDGCKAGPSVAGKPSSTWSWLVCRFKFDSLFNQAKPSSRPISSLQAQPCYSHDLVVVINARRASKLPASDFHSSWPLSSDFDFAATVK